MASLAGRVRWPGTSSISRLARCVQDDTLADRDGGGPEHDLDKRSLQERRLHAEREVAAALAAIDWPARLCRLPGWRWDADSSVLRCPADEGPHAASVRKRPAQQSARNRRSWTERTAAYPLPPGAGVRRRCRGLDHRGAGLAGYGLANWGARP